MILNFNQGIKERAGLHYQVFIIGIILLLLDQLIKFLAYSFIPLIDKAIYQYPYGGIGVFRNFLGIEFSLNYTTNKGAAWGVLSDYQFFLIILRIILITALSIYFCCFNRYSSWQIPLILIIFGAIGNVLDFFIYGQVIDLFHFVLWGYDFPIFNLADSAICIGVGALFLLSWLES